MVPSPQLTVYVPAAPPTGMVIDMPSLVVCQVVIKLASSVAASTVTVRVSVTSLEPSLTSSSNASVAPDSATGAVNDGESVSAPDSAIRGRPDLWVQE